MLSAGTAAVLMDGQKEVGVLRKYLGKLEHHTVYEAQLVGILLGIYTLTD